MLTEQQRQNRSDGIFCSELGAWAGLSTFSTPALLTLEKVGLLERRPIEPDMAEAGDRGEVMLRAWLSDILGRPVLKNETDWQDAEFPRLQGHIDGWVDKTDEGAEFKMVGPARAGDYGPSHTMQIPDDVLLQVYGYLRITDAERWHVLALVNSTSKRHYIIDRSAESDELVLTIARNAWAMVENAKAGNLPELDEDNPKTADALARMYRAVNDETVELTATHLAAVKRRKQIRAEISTLEAEERSLSNRLKKAMGNAGLGALPDGSMLVRKQINRAESYRKASSFIQLTHKVKK